MNEAQKDTLRANLAKARAVRAANRAASREAAPPVGTTMNIDADPYEAMQQAQSVSSSPQTAAARTQTRSPLRSGQFLGRNGEVLSRSPVNMKDTFDVPLSMIPDEWEYQWNIVTVVGNPDIARDQSHTMYTNGWRPVPSERHAGILVPPNSKGDIVRGGLRLEERPKAMCDQARLQDVRNAQQQITDRNEVLKLSGIKKNMTDGFEMGPKYRGTGGNIKLSIDRGLDIPAPTHTLAEPE
mgnify:CR=1 FL=1